MSIRKIEQRIYRSIDIEIQILYLQLTVQFRYNNNFPSNFTQNVERKYHRSYTFPALFFSPVPILFLLIRYAADIGTLHIDRHGF